MALLRWEAYGQAAEGRRRTQNLKPGDKTQTAKDGTKIGLLPRATIFADFKKIVRGKRP